MNQCNNLCGEEPTDPPGEWNSQHTVSHFQYRTYPTKTNPVVSDIMGRLNHHAINNGDVEVQT